MSDFKLNQDVIVKGQPAVFVGYMSNGHEAQVCMASRKTKPNVIVPLGEIAPLIQGSKAHKTTKAENQVVTTTSV